MPYTEQGIGWKDRETSAEAAKKAHPKAQNLRTQTLQVFRDCGPLTADEVAEILGRSFISIRPRVTELANADLIYDTLVRRKSAFGHSAIVWAINEDKLP